MGYNVGKPLVADSLVIGIDAGNYRSYNGSGVNIVDLKGIYGNSVLQNGAVYNSDGSGSISFDGVNDYVYLPPDYFRHAPTNPFSYNVWFKSSQTTGGPIFGQQGNSVPAVGQTYVPVLYLRSDGIIRSEAFWTGATSTAIVNTRPLNDNLWHNVCVTFLAGTHKLYIDGEYVAQQTGINQVYYDPVYYYFLGAVNSAGRGLGTNFFKGTIGPFMFYSKELSQSEIQQNFNALRGRFGV